MARNLLLQIEFSKYNTTGVVFIENSFESSKVAELMFSNISNPGYLIYRVFKHASFTTNYYKPDKYKFVKDVPTQRWNALFHIGYKRFPEICKGKKDHFIFYEYFFQRLNPLVKIMLFFFLEHGSILCTASRA